MMLEVESLAFGYPGRTVAREVGFSLACGETMCVLGPNGSGKSTLFRTILGLLPVQSGSVRLEGEPLERLSRLEVARRAAYVPQTHAAHFAFTVREFVLMGRAARLGPFSAPGAKDRAACERALAALGIAALGERAITELSGGERQLALVARALAQEPLVLVLDEPTAELDFGNQQRVLGMLARLASSGIAVLFSTHDPNHALAFAQRSLLLGQGRALALGAPHDVVRPDLLEELYGVPVDVLRPENGTRGYAVRPRQRQETP